MNKCRWHLLVLLFLALAILVLKWNQMLTLEYLQRLSEVKSTANASKETGLRNDASVSQVHNTGLQTDNSVLPEDDDAYEFLYGKEYQNAIEKAANAPKKVGLILGYVRLRQLLVLLTS